VNIFAQLKKQRIKHMQTLTNRAEAVSRKPMSWWEKLYLPSIFKGMAITFSHIFKKRPTINYPEKTRPFSPVFRGLHVLNRDEEGRERCTACGLCAVACPAEAITMEAAERQNGEEQLYREEKYAAKYEINMLRCIFCGLCEEACPKDAIYLSETFAPAHYNRRGFIYGKNELLIPNPLTEAGELAKAKGVEI
jgi:NADH-quinone oxidoreductase subunit I